MRASKNESPPQRTSGQRLTKRQRATLECLLRGLSDKMAAAELGISRRGIRRHVQALHLKYGVNSRLELAAVFLGLHGITTDRSPLTR